jgi:predicted neuraminidase
MHVLSTLWRQQGYSFISKEQPMSWLRTFLCAAILQTAALPLWAAALGEFIFAPGSTSFAASHASALVQLKDGKLLSAWFGGTAEGKPDVAIWSSRQTVDGWTTQVELARESDVPCWNPVLFHTADGRLWL